MGTLDQNYIRNAPSMASFSSVWLDTHKHLSGARAYNMEWEDFLANKPNATVDDVMEFAEKLMTEIYK